MTVPRVEVHEDAATVATTVAGELLSRLVSAQRAGRVPQIALTGGSIADAVHREVARLAPDAGVDWSRVVVWWGDERFVGAESDERNAVQARAAFGDSVPLHPDHVHEVPSTAAAGSVADAATAYAQAMREHGAGEFEVVMLGVGPDGHVASLFPGHAALDVDDQIAVGVTDSPKPPPERVTLTLPALNRTRAAWFLVSGEEKSAAVASALGGADVHETPAAGVAGQQETVWFLDRAAASKL